MGNPLTEAMGNVLTMLVGNVLTEGMAPIHHQKNEKTSLHPYVRMDFAQKTFTHWVKKTAR